VEEIGDELAFNDLHFISWSDVYKIKVKLQGEKRTVNAQGNEMTVLSNRRWRCTLSREQPISARFHDTTHAKFGLSFKPERKS
jgi:hypothetical protein